MPTCRRPPLFFFCKITIRSAIGAFGERLDLARRAGSARSRHRADSSCVRKSRSSSWAKRTRATPRFFSSPTTTKNWRTRCETAGAVNLQASSNSAIRCSCRKSPTRMRDETFDRSKPVAGEVTRRADKISTGDCSRYADSISFRALTGRARSMRRPLARPPSARAGAWVTAQSSPSPAISGRKWWQSSRFAGMSCSLPRKRCSDQRATGGLSLIRRSPSWRRNEGCGSLRSRQASRHRDRVAGLYKSIASRVARHYPAHTYGLGTAMRNRR